MTLTKDPYNDHYDRQVEEHVAALVEELNDCMPLTADEMRGYVSACRHWLHGRKGEPEQPADVASPEDFRVGVRMGVDAARNYALVLLRRQMRERARDAVWASAGFSGDGFVMNVSVPLPGDAALTSGVGAFGDGEDFRDRK